jgi:hypothetical protein
MAVASLIVMGFAFENVTAHAGIAKETIKITDTAHVKV